MQNFRLLLGLGTYTDLDEAGKCKTTDEMKVIVIYERVNQQDGELGRGLPAIYAQRTP